MMHTQKGGGLQGPTLATNSWYAAPKQPRGALEHNPQPGRQEYSRVAPMMRTQEDGGPELADVVHQLARVALEVPYPPADRQKHFLC